MTHSKPADYDHLLTHAQTIFPGSTLAVIHIPDEIIYIDVDGHRFTFEIGSDDDEYFFTDGKTTFTIPLMDLDDEC